MIMMIIYDATDTIVGRLATKVAKSALLGEKIVIINCEKAIMTGNKENVLQKFKSRRDRGIPLKGPYIHREPEKIVKRIIRGMLPYKTTHGKEALKRIMCYIGIPDEFKDKKYEVLEKDKIAKLSTLNYLTIREISTFLGAK